MSREVLVRLLDEIGAEAGLDLKLDENDCCTFSASGSGAAFLRYDEPTEHVLFVAPVASLPDDEEEQRRLLAYYLSMNYGGTEADGGYFALDEDSGFVLLQVPVDIRNITAADFTGAVAGFAQQAGYWKRRFIDLLESHAEEADDPFEEQSADDMPDLPDPSLLA